ncbi:patatin-like phospholipase family protein [Telmatospirillum sp.]|uniref:patatin-like phospholipase family protein n=1 Tax=Telmatospirillum sp. TaxID=2079197 RepID=UPI00284CF59E|nr:patatin-like phospholipase family protein [Telmatospirillum sp.]MDR3441301.1 patatin-like phospholipase family protein [Telmatospirillum sp.]
MLLESLSYRRNSALPVRSGGELPISLALQGGGAYGAYAWGVLDRLLEEDDLGIAGISGASAGAINAVVTAWGLLNGGRDGAREALRRLWTAVGQMSLLSPFSLPGASLQFDLMTRVMSPYQFNPLNINPLRDLLLGMIDFDRLRVEGQTPLFISATNVSTGDQRIFREKEITIDVLMASSCLPYVSQAVEIDGQAYWDGGFSSNPPVLPLVLETDCRSLLLVKLTADEEPDLPTAAPEIFARLKRILFNAPLLRDLDALSEMQKLLRRTNLLPRDLRRLRDLVLYKVTIDHAFFSASNGSALDPRPEMVSKLFEAGRVDADTGALPWASLPDVAEAVSASH